MTAILAVHQLERPRPAYVRRPALILVNGLAGQRESWYCNLEDWRRHFDVYQPNILVYDGAAIQRRIEREEPIDIAYLVERLHAYLDGFVQAPPYHLAANSLGGQVAVQFALCFPEWVDRLVLLSPSGLSSEERMPVVDGVRWGDMRRVVESVFGDPRQADPAIVRHYQEQIASRRWRQGVLRTLRGTSGQHVRDLLPLVKQPTLVVVGRQDRIVNVGEVIEAAGRLPRGRLVVLEDCGHAPQVERPDIVNRLVSEFLRADDAESSATDGSPLASQGD